MNITITHGIAHIGMAEQWNSIGNNCSECCSDLGLNHTCRNIENELFMCAHSLLATTQFFCEQFWPRSSWDVRGSDTHEGPQESPEARASTPRAEVALSGLPGGFPVGDTEAGGR